MEPPGSIRRAMLLWKHREMRRILPIAQNFCESSKMCPRTKGRRAMSVSWLWLNRTVEEAGFLRESVDEGMPLSLKGPVDLAMILFFICRIGVARWRKFLLRSKIRSAIERVPCKHLKSIYPTSFPL